MWDVSMTGGDKPRQLLLHRRQRGVIVGILGKVESLVEIAQLRERIARRSGRSCRSAIGRCIILSRCLRVELMIDTRKRWKSIAPLQEFQHRAVLIKLS